MKAFSRALAFAVVAFAFIGSAIAATPAMQCAPNQPIVSAAGTTYSPDRAGFLSGVAANDITDLQKAGCQLIGVAGETIIGRLLGANMNSTGDQAIELFVPANSYFRVTKISVKNASTSLTTAVGGVYTAASKGGDAVVANTQVYSGLTGGTLAVDLTIATTPGKTEYATSTPLYLALTTPQGAAATADVFVYGQLGK